MQSKAANYSRSQNSCRLDHRELLRHFIVSNRDGIFDKFWRHLYVTWEPTGKLSLCRTSSGGSALLSLGSGPQSPVREEKTHSGGAPHRSAQRKRAQRRGAHRTPRATATAGTAAASGTERSPSRPAGIWGNPPVPAPPGPQRKKRSRPRNRGSGVLPSSSLLRLGGSFHHPAKGENSTETQFSFNIVIVISF